MKPVGLAHRELFQTTLLPLTTAYLDTCLRHVALDRCTVVYVM